MEPTIYINSSSANVMGLSTEIASQVLAFHRKLPQYDETPLHSLPTLAKELQLGHVFVKDESGRFGLPSFKILGASWAVFRALAEKLGLDPASLVEDTRESSQLWEDLGAKAKTHGFSLVTCSEGNWGRAVARMARYLGMPARILIPAFMPETTRARIRSEGVEIIVVDGSYDDSVAAARREADVDDKVILVMDMGWDGYEQIPEQWVVEGYTTMLREADAQVLAMTRGITATHAFIPVGVGSIAHAVTRHYKSTERDQSSRASVITVEPTTAACFKASLEAGRITPVHTGDSIMCGMNCGTVSSTAWPVLQPAVNADVTVTDYQAHMAVCELESLGLQPGPCGAATLAALRTACRDARAELHLSPSSVVVLFCTEGKREYAIPVAEG
ncbi:hypothetical protein M406DRAFT_43718 [Cryphonectria parasitica EP155]|uniref:Tryptophan synthase beta chain-like PALP domain-containing protein n=1 Tax=Cryphonectria parasitica (strain ATCC 38755 / EP155) TaxID=660469 RepID=A0A9P5CMJ8_CRYP1|nr:uncharacterized protein M406DRAFT_43718 [Cryphonectria parasitica EP155]KAF3764178.1 hypothetical protein M406DRAFT_43718 [Cryphonectria parasitica EP155]